MNSEKLKDQNIQKFCSFTLTMNNSKTKLRKKLHLQFHLFKKNIILRNKLNQGDEKYVHLKLHDTAERNSNIWKDISFPWIRRLNGVKMSTLCKAICRLSAIPVIILLRI